jgi:hypothetical protein
MVAREWTYVSLLEGGDLVRVSHLILVAAIFPLLSLSSVLGSSRFQYPLVLFLSRCVLLLSVCQIRCIQEFFLEALIFPFLELLLLAQALTKLDGHTQHNKKARCISVSIRDGELRPGIVDGTGRAARTSKACCADSSACQAWHISVRQQLVKRWQAWITSYPGNETANNTRTVCASSCPCSSFNSLRSEACSSPRQQW